MFELKHLSEHQMMIVMDVTLIGRDDIKKLDDTPIWPPPRRDTEPFTYMRKRKTAGSPSENLRYDEETGLLLSERELGYELDEQDLLRLQQHIRVPGQMFPLDDPRWGTHCQWCAQAVDMRTACYYAGLYHQACYRNLFLPCLICAKRSLEVYHRVHPYQVPPGSWVRQDAPGPQVCDVCLRQTQKTRPM